MKKNDVLLIGVILLAALAVMGYHYLKKDGGTGRAVVTVDGKLYGTYDLWEDRTIDIKGMNTLKLGGGRADMAHASCPDGLCVRHKPISRAGESIICLPNKVVVTVEGGQERELDAVTN